MDLGKALTFTFEDEQWPVKLLVGGVLLLIPLFGSLVLMGYLIATVRNVLAGRPRPLPRWDDLGRLFVDGLLVWVALLIYALPLVLLVCPVVLVWLLPFLGGEHENIVGVLTGLSALTTVGIGCIGFLYGLLLAVLSPAVYLQYAGHGDLGACLRVGDVVRFAFRNLGSILLILLVYLAVAILLGLTISTATGILGWIPCVGWILSLLLTLVWLPASVWLMAFQGHLIGQIGREAGFPSPVHPTI